MNTLSKTTLLFFTLTLIACGGGSSGGDPETPAGTPAPTETALSIANAQGNEGENITFTVTSNPNIAKAISFRYQVNFTGTANTSDFTGGTSGDITIATGDSNATIEIPIAKDGLSEPDETFDVILSDLAPTDATFTNKTAIGTILANEPIKISIADASGDEGSNIVFNVTATKNLANPIVFSYTILFNVAIPSDLTGATTGEVTIATGDNNTKIEIPTFDDRFKESNETFQIQLSAQLPLGTVFTNPTSIDKNQTTATGTIRENDPDGIIAISVANAKGNEGENITFKVTSGLVTEQVNFSYQVNFANQTAIASDLISGQTTGTSTIDANNNSTTISIAIENDSIPEPNETFQIMLSNLSTTDATFTKSAAIGTILANDPQISIADATASEGENIIFTVTSNQAIAEQISFNYQVDFDNPQDLDSASADDLSGTTKSRATIDANNNNTTIEIRTVNDSLREKAEGFSVILSDLTPTDATFGVDNIGRGTILASDNDASGRVIISLVANAQASEDSGTINFKITSKFPAISAFTFNYAVVLDNPTTPNSASSDDFAGATTGTATIPVDASSTTISISLTRDTIAEPDETFSLRLTTPTSANVILANNSVTGTILNDDVSNVSDATATIGDSQITLNWTNPSDSIFAGVTIAQATSDTAPLSCNLANNVTIIDALKTTIRRNITGLTNGTAYSFRICARSTAGSLSSGVGLANIIPIKVDKDEDGLIEIATATELNNIRYNLAGTSYKTNGGAGSGLITGCPNSGCNGYELTANIDLIGFTNWTPIGTFTATFDGNNKTISNLTINRAGESNIGLFSIVSGATIKNLKLANVDITGDGSVGALVGQTTGTTTLSNIELIGDGSQSSSDAEIKGNGISVGGLVGRFQSGTITDASSSLTVTGHSRNTVANTGGLVGSLTAGGSIKNSNSSGSVSASGGADIVGGLVGFNGGSISNSWASGNVFSRSIIGGLVGENGGNISNSWASGNISGKNTIGGLVGNNSNSGGRTSNSWASGEVSGSGHSIGGLIGLNIGTISNSWASGEVTGDSNVGGLVGSNNLQSAIFGKIKGRNYRLDSDRGLSVNASNSIQLATTDLASLSGASGGTATTNSEWHAGFDSANPVSGTNIDLKTRFCDTDGSGSIETSNRNRHDEQVATNSVWVMPPTANDNVTTTTNEAGVTATYYQIPAIRCIANTAGITDQTTIDAMRKIEIDRQRRKFPQ